MFTTENLTATYGLFSSYDQIVFDLEQSRIADNKKIKRYQIYTKRYKKPPTPRSTYTGYTGWIHQTRGVHGFETFEDALECFNQLWSEGRAIDAPLSIVKMNSIPKRRTPSVSFWTFMTNNRPQIIAEYDKENPLDDTEPLWTPGGSVYGLWYSIPNKLRLQLTTLMSGAGCEIPKTFKQAFTIAEKV